MSGAEIIGLAASVISIAELGGKLSVKIFTFTRKIKNANKTIDALSQEIAVTGAVLQQLGETLSNDNSVKVCSQEAVDTAKKLVSDTEKVFKSLAKLLDDEENNNTKLRKAVNLKRLKFPFLESEIEEVQANLERLKSSLLVILNVLIFAEQLRNRETLPILEDQRDLIRTLAAEKDANEQRYKLLLKAIADRPKIVANDDGKGVNTFGSNVHAISTKSTTLTLVNTGDSASQRSAASAQPTTRRVTDLPLVDLPEGLKYHHERIHNHTQLVQNLLTEIDCLEYKIGHSARGRLQDEVLDVHWEEWSAQRRQFGIEPLERMIAGSSEVARYWGVKHFDEQQQARGRRLVLLSPEVAERLARLKALEELNAREEKQNAWAAKIEEEARMEEERKVRIALDYEAEIRKGHRAEEEVIAKAEAARARGGEDSPAERAQLAAVAARQKAELQMMLEESRRKCEKSKGEAEREAEVWMPGGDSWTQFSGEFTTKQAQKEETPPYIEDMPLEQSPISEPESIPLPKPLPQKKEDVESSDRYKETADGPRVKKGLNRSTSYDTVGTDSAFSPLYIEQRSPLDYTTAAAGRNTLEIVTGFSKPRLPRYVQFSSRRERDAPPRERRSRKSARYIYRSSDSISTEEDYLPRPYSEPRKDTVPGPRRSTLLLQNEQAKDDGMSQKITSEDIRFQQREDQLHKEKRIQQLEDELRKEKLQRQIIEGRAAEAKLKQQNLNRREPDFNDLILKYTNIKSEELEEAWLDEEFGGVDVATPEWEEVSN